MPLMPKRVKYRKSQRRKMKGKATRGNRVSFGEYGLQALQGCWLSAQQLEAGRVAITHFLAREGRVHVRVFPHKPVSAKPAEVRMGTGKGEVDFWAAVVKPGTVLYELGGVGEEQARLAFNRAAHKMPVRCRFIQRSHRV